MFASNKGNGYSVRSGVLIISHITFRDCRVHIFYDNLLEIAVDPLTYVT